MNPSAIWIGRKSGIVKDIYIQELGVKLLSGNFMAGKNTAKSGAKDDNRIISVET